jgi:hypothetical protein
MLQTQLATRRLGTRGAVAGLVVSGVLVAMGGCQPGALPCDKDQEWAAICKGDASVIPGSGGGSGSGSGGSSGASGGAGNGSGGAAGSGGGVTAATALPNCSKYKTLGGMDEFFGMRCAASPACHDGAGGGAWTNLKMADVWMRLKDVKAKFSCRDDMVIDSKTWDKSVVWRKTHMPVMCAGPNPAMSVMPPPAIEPKMPMITTDEENCLKDFLQKIAGM